MEIQAAIGLEQLKDLDAFILKRREIARYVKSQLLNTVFEVIDCGTLEDTELEKRHSWMFLCIRINKRLNSDLRTQLDNLLEKYGIESRPVLTGNFLKQPVMQNFRNSYGISEFPAADSISTQYFMVSAHHDLTREQIQYLAKSLKTIANQL
jgi:CDP-6-deoxy-D-xylo-4-hexulose-3-dehydrase